MLEFLQGRRWKISSLGSLLSTYLKDEQKRNAENKYFPSLTEIYLKS